MTSRKTRILYVDENAEESYTLTTLLKLAGYEAVTTNYASDAFQLAQMDEYDLYILSRRFPVDSGVYLCQRLNKISPRTPIVFLSNDDGRRGVVRSGSEEYLAKSRDAREILSAVESALAPRCSATDL